MKMSKMMIIVLAAVFASLTAFKPKASQTPSNQAFPGEYYAYQNGMWYGAGDGTVYCEGTNDDICSGIEDDAGNVVVLAYGGPAIIIN